jgi:FKBP-type peptidyl-prolyl cis-trans isomerase FklB
VRTLVVHTQRRYLTDHAKNPTVTVLESGLQFRILRSGTDDGAATPSVSSPCECHYEGELTDGTKLTYP